ncbi:hypothetical protein BKA70DRAFT_1253285 [Coprinopsis sp. MPI-PUGE-AT-0042]|nr:hypothetical protein BKA70DRAFT_1253285 [Coprinopsis sp. MPI-PUGE-AT-0042]
MSRPPNGPAFHGEGKTAEGVSSAPVQFVLHVEEELSRKQGETPDTGIAHAHEQTGLNQAGSRHAPSSSKSAQADGTPEPAVKKRKRPVAEGLNLASAEKKPTPSRKRKKQDVLLTGETSSSVHPVPGSTNGGLPSLMNPIHAPESNGFAEFCSTFEVNLNGGAYMPVGDFLPDTLPIASKSKGKGKAKASASATLPVSGLFTWRPLGMPVEDTQTEEVSSPPKDKAKAKAEVDPMDVDMPTNPEPGASVSATPVKRKRGRPRAETQPTVPITDILDLRPEPEDPLAKCNQTWKVASNSLPSLKSLSETSDPSTSSRSTRAANRNQPPLAPRVWASSREELYATIPALAPSKGSNSVHWMNCDTPIVMLDDQGQPIRTIDIFPVEGRNDSECLFDLILTRKLVPAPASSKKNLAPVIDLTKDDEVSVADERPHSLSQAGPSTILEPFESKELLSFEDTAQTGFRILSPMKNDSAPLVQPVLRYTPALQQVQLPVVAETFLDGADVGQIGIRQGTNPPYDGPKVEERSLPQVQDTPLQQAPAGDPMEVDSAIPLVQPLEITVKEEAVEPALSLPGGPVPSASAPVKGKGKGPIRASDIQPPRRTVRPNAGNRMLPPPVRRRRRTVQVKQEETSISLSQPASLPAASTSATTGIEANANRTMFSISAPPTIAHEPSRPALWLDTSLSVIDLTMDSPLTPISSPPSPLSPLPPSFEAPKAGPSKRPAPPKPKPLTRREAARQGGEITFAYYVKKKRIRGPNRPKPGQDGVRPETQQAVAEPEERPITVTVKVEGEEVTIPHLAEDAGPSSMGQAKVEPIATRVLSDDAMGTLVPKAPPASEIVIVDDASLTTIVCENPADASVPDDTSMATIHGNLELGKVKEEEQLQLIGNAVSVDVPQTDTTAGQLKSSLPSLPSEIKVLVDTFIQGTPISIVASYDRMFELLPESSKRSLCKEFALAYLGFFHILGLEETQILSTEEDSKVDYPTFQWKFRIKWIAGGEQRSIGGVSLGPWWLPSQAPANPVVVATSGGPVEGTSAAPDTASRLATPVLYLQAQESHPNHPLRDLLSGDTSAPLVPNTLLVELRSCQSDEAFPTGWLCPGCGKVNFQLAMRHRQCSSTACLKISQKGKRVPQYLARELADVRGPHGGSPVCLPFNEHSKGNVKATYTTWKNGMKTFLYSFEENIAVKHIFTSNVPVLQSVATSLLMDVQREVQLSRTMGDSSNPYFTATYDVKSDIPSTSVKVAVPECLMKARELLLNRAALYADLPEDSLKVTTMDVMGWVSSGSRKNSSDVIKATHSPVVILALGCDIVLTLSPLEDAQIKVAKPKKGKQVQLQESSSAVEASVPVTSKRGRGRPRKVKRGPKPKSCLPDPPEGVTEPSSLDVSTEPGPSSAVGGQSSQGPELLQLPRPLLPHPSSLMDAQQALIEEPPSSSVPPKLRRHKGFLAGPMARPSVHTANSAGPLTATVVSETTISQASVPYFQASSMMRTEPDPMFTASTSQVVSSKEVSQVLSSPLPIPPFLAPTSQPPLSVDTTEPPPPVPRTTQLTMVHGDVVVVTGCDFEYSLKRLGSSILIFGSSTP